MLNKCYFLSCSSMNEMENTSAFYDAYDYDLCDNEINTVFSNQSIFRQFFYYTLFGLGLLGRFKYECFVFYLHFIIYCILKIV